MDFFNKKCRYKTLMYLCSQKCKRWRRTASAALCLVLLGTNMVWAAAAEVPIEGISHLCIHEHTEDCDPALGVECTHVCTVENGCIAKTQEPLVHRIEEWTWNEGEGFLNEYDGEWYLSLSGVNMQELTKALLTKMLPGGINVVLGDGGSETLPITWDFAPFSGGAKEEIYRLDAALAEGYVLAEGVIHPYVILTFDDAEEYAAVYPGSRETFADREALKAALADHQVRGITPAGTTINLFDYVASKDGAVEMDITEKVPLNDVLQPSLRAAKPDQWNLGINENRLLLFGDSMVGAGYWNIGAGAGRPWAQENTNMKDIVERTLTSGYPYINRAAADAALVGVDGFQESQLPAFLAWAADADQKGAYQNAPALSQRVLENCHDLSLAYLFDPDQKLGENVKRTYENVTGLFRMDENGYYYYDARKNFAEFKEAENENVVSKDGRKSDGAFILYDGPAVWRSDGGFTGSGFNGDKSLGNFYPFNTGEQVFDSVETTAAGKILSSSAFLDNTKWGASNGSGLTNAATNDEVFINHHIGMTMTVDFTQPEDGKLNMGSSGKQDMVFEFSGDDDVWIFIDDVLVLDLGGIHSELYGTINFSTGEVVTGQSWRYGGLPDNPGGHDGDTKTTLYDLFAAALGQDKADGLDWVTGSGGGKVFPTGTNHSLKLFYLERGNYDSSLQMRFNLQPPLYHRIQKVDQNGEPMEGVEMELYAAKLKDGITQESTNVDDYQRKGEKIGTLVTGADGTVTFAKTNAEGGTTPFSFTDRYHSDGTIYYILKEIKTIEGYRLLPKDIVLKFNPDTSMLVVANRYQTGAYASFLSNVKETGTLTYGQFDAANGDIRPSVTTLAVENKRDGLVIAVPMLLGKYMSLNGVQDQGTEVEEAAVGKWVALYGSNTEGYGAVIPEERTAAAWRKAVLKAALYQCSDLNWPAWYIQYNEDTMKLEDLIEDLPGRADRYALNNPVDADMKMVYGIIEPYALDQLGVTGNTSKERYRALEEYVADQINAALHDADNAGKLREEVVEAVIEEIFQTLYNAAAQGTKYDDTTEQADRGFTFLNTDQFQREFRSIIYIPNERRELNVWKVDEYRRGVNGAEFTLYKRMADGGAGADEAIVSGVTANIGGKDGILIFTPDAPVNDIGKTMPGYADVKWMESDSFYYILKETKAPDGYELNPTEIPVILGHYSVYADAGSPDDGVTVMAGVGKLMQTMTKYAADDIVNITLRDITAIAQTQDSIEDFGLDKWQDDLLTGTSTPRSMNLHYGINAVVDYGLHDEDGGKNTYPFFTTDTGFLRTRIEQNSDALKNERYQGNGSLANWDDLSGRDITNLFSQLNIVVVTDRKVTSSNTGRLRIDKTVSGENLSDGDKSKTFCFTVTLNDTNISGNYGDMIFTNGVATFMLKHGESMRAEGLPAGIQYIVSESDNIGYKVTCSGEAGSIEAGQTAMVSFNNHKDGSDVPESPDASEFPGASGSPDAPESPGASRVPDASQDPYVPDGSATSVEPGSYGAQVPLPKPSQSGVTAVHVPKTGDETNLTFWLVLLCITGVGMVALLAVPRRHKGKHNKGKRCKRKRYKGKRYKR